MTLTAVNGGGFYYPSNLCGLGRVPQGTTTVGTMDAAAEKVAFVGRAFLPGGEGTSKTISAAGGGSIVFAAGAVTFANGSTTLDIGIQDVDITTGAPARPDGTFDVKRTYTGGTDTITTGLNTIAMTGGSGSKTIAHGDLIAITFDMTALGGTDSVVVRGQPTQASQGTMLPSCLVNTGSWTLGGSSATAPCCVIIFDDGTFGMLDGGYIHGTNSTESFSDSTNPDERGLLFQIPWDCAIDALWVVMGVNNATTADMAVDLYSDPLGTPASVLGGAITVTAETFAATIGTGAYLVRLSSAVNLTRDTNYALAIKATSTGNAVLFISTLVSEGSRILLMGGTTLAKVTRNGGSGAFSAESPAVTMYQMGVRISKLHDRDSSKGKLTGLLG